MKLNDRSWHYRLANDYGHGDFGSRTDLCAYARHILFGTFMCVLIVAAALIVGSFLLLDPLLWVALCISEGRLMPMLSSTIAALAVWGAVVTFITVCILRDVAPELPEPILEAYRGYKERYCPVIEFDSQRS